MQTVVALIIDYAGLKNVVFSNGLILSAWRHISQIEWRDFQFFLNSTEEIEQTITAIREIFATHSGVKHN